jgi:transcriptional regulator with XRE-family HTH domain
MTSFKDFLQDQFKDDKNLEKDFYKGLEKTRIAIEIAAAREKAGLTQTELARRVGMSQSAIARMENTGYQNYSIRTLRKIAKVLELELFVTLRDKKQPNLTN